MNIGDIRWPEDPRAAVALYLRYLVKVVAELDIDFPSDLPNPTVVAEGFADGSVNESDYVAAAEAWWGYIDKRFGPTDLKTREALEARVAICLLSARIDEAPRLGEHMSWFFEVLGFLGLKLAGPLQTMASHFDSKASAT